MSKLLIMGEALVEIMRESVDTGLFQGTLSERCTGYMCFCRCKNGLSYGFDRRSG